MSRLLEKDVLFLFGPPYSLGWGRAQNMARELSQRTRVLYVEQPPALRPFLRNPWKHTLGATRWEQVTESLIIHRPFSLPLGRSRPVRGFNARLFRNSIRRGMARFELSPGIVWFYEHYGVLLAGSFDGEVRVSDFAAPPRPLPGMISPRDIPFVRRQQELMASRCDLVFAETELHAQELARFNCNTFALPPGVDLELFRAARAETTRVPQEIESFSRPRLGFCGFVQDWVDLAAVEFAARHHPDWSIIFVGPVKVDVGELRWLPNVHFIGERPYRKLPGYLKAMDVLLLPYRRCFQTDYSDTPKILQYLASGKPAVSTSFSTSDRFRDLVLVAESPAEFEAGIVRCLRGEWRPDPAAVEQRLAERSWSRVVDKALGQIDEVLKARPRSTA